VGEETLKRDLGFGGRDFYEFAPRSGGVLEEYSNIRRRGEKSLLDGRLGGGGGGGRKPQNVGSSVNHITSGGKSIEHVVKKIRG